MLKLYVFHVKGHKMLWIVVLLMCCLQTGSVESKECKNSTIIVGRLGEELMVTFPSSDPREEYNKYIPGQYGQKIIQNKINIQNLTKESEIPFKNMKNFSIQDIDYNEENCAIFRMNDTLVVKIQEDDGIYWIEFNSIYLNPVLKAEDNYSTILQLECHSVSTSIGDCQLYNSMYIMWYKNGMRMTELDPTLSQINVTVDHNGGNFTCLAIEYRPCYHRLQTTKYYDDGLNIEECDSDKVYEGETSSVKPHHVPIDVKKETDQRKITVNPHGEAKKNFILNATETENNAEKNNVIVAVTVVIVIIVFVLVVVIVVIMYKKFHEGKNGSHNEVPDDSLSEEGIYETIDDWLPGTSGDNNSRNSDQNQDREEPTYDVLGAITPSVYESLTKKRRRYPKIWNWILMRKNGFK